MHSSSVIGNGKFYDCKKFNPCPICDSNTGKCKEYRLIDQTKHYCMNVISGSVNGYKLLGMSSDGNWGVWAESTITPTVAKNIVPIKSNLESLWNLEERDYLYKQIISQLDLKPEDREDLKSRGLSDSDIDSVGFRSVEPHQKLKKPVNPKLPGVNRTGDSLIVEKGGYLCPARDYTGRIVASQVRFREGDTRYRWLSTGGRVRLENHELPLSVYRSNDEVLGFTEGVGVKPLITAKLTGNTVIGAAGGCFSSSPQLLKEAIENIKCKQAIFYPDAGSVINHHILQTYKRNFELIKGLVPEFKVAWWEQTSKDDFDIDEVCNLDTISFIDEREFWDTAKRAAVPLYLQITEDLGCNRNISGKDAIEILRDVFQLRQQKEALKYRRLVRELLRDLDLDWQSQQIAEFIESVRVSDYKSLRLQHLKTLKRRLEQCLENGSINLTSVY